ncbi:MAG: hypothetical protein AAFN11_06165, partial [Chloroflexota bacterium]
TYDGLPATLPARETMQASLVFLTPQFAGDGILSLTQGGITQTTFLARFAQSTPPVSAEHLNVQLRGIRRTHEQIFVDVRIYNPQSETVTLAEGNVGMVFGFTPLPVGVTARPSAYEPLVFAPDTALDVTLTWTWNGDDPYARLLLAGRVWAISLIES